MTACSSAREEPRPEDCTGFAAVTWICQVEGREVNLCLPCSQAWKVTARRNPALINRCPNCAPSYYASRQVRDRGPRTGTISPDSRPYTGPLADAIDRAMLAEGILTDVRKRVLSRLAEDEDPYIGMLLRSASGASV